jgi:hypothetical protein
MIRIVPRIARQTLQQVLTLLGAASKGANRAKGGALNIDKFLWMGCVRPFRRPPDLRTISECHGYRQQSDCV